LWQTIRMMRWCCALLLLARHWQALDADERALEKQIAKAVLLGVVQA